MSAAYFCSNSVASISVWVRTLNIGLAPLHKVNLITETLRHGTRCRDITALPAQFHAFTNERSKPHLPLPFCLPTLSWSSFTDAGGIEG